MDLNNVSKKAAIGIAAIAGGAYTCLTNDAVLALMPPAFALVIKTFLIGAVSGGVYFSMKPKEDEPKG